MIDGLDFDALPAAPEPAWAPWAALALALVGLALAALTVRP